MAAEGIAKRATIGVGFHTNQEAIDAFEHSLRTIGEDTSKLRDTFNRTNLAMDRFNEHMSSFTGRYRESMDGVREANRQAVESTHHVNSAVRNSTDIHNRDTDKYIENLRQQNEAARQRTENELLNDHKQINEMSNVLQHQRENNAGMIRDNQQLKDRLESVGTASEHAGNRIATANGRVAHSFRYANGGINRHIQSVRDAQGRDYRWLRTAQDMSGATLGLGAAFYKGAKDATTLQQAYIHAGNMAHYGGEKVSQVQHDINQQWKVGSQLSIKYGVSQDQIADGYKALVARGYTTNEALHTQKSLLQAAIASGDSYNDVVQGTTNVLDAYNLRSNNAAVMTNNTKKVTDEMAYSADQTASNFRDLSTGMAYVAATAHTTNQPISETSSALGILSNKGMQASMAGVGLRKVLNSFLSINKKGQQAQVMQQLGLNQNSFRTASGHLKSLGQLMGILNAKTKNMGSAERGAVFHRFFGATGQEAALNLASDTKGLAQLNKQVEKSQTMGSKQQGYVALLSQHNMKSAQNQFNEFKRAWEAFTITAAREILPDFTGALKHLDVYLAKLNDLSPKAKKWTIFGALAVAAIAPISYAIFGIQSAFHGVEITLLHVRRLFAKPISHTMTTSADKQAAEQKAAADIENGKSNLSLNKSNGLNFVKDYKHSDTRQFEMDRFPRLTNAMRGVTHFGGDYGPESALSIAGTMRKPSMVARLNPFNKSARFFTGRFIPGFKTRSIETGLNASHLLRGTAGDIALRAGGSLLGKVNLITGIASSLPLVEKGLKWIDHTRIGGKIFAPFNKSLIHGMNGPVKFIDRSWKFIKRGALDAIKPIENEWHKMFSGESKSSRANLRGLKEFVHISTGLIGGLFRTIAKVAGNVLKYGGHAIAGIMKTLRGLGTLAGGVADLFTLHFGRAFHLLSHGANLTFSGIWNTVSSTVKGIGTSLGDVFNGVWTTMKHIKSTVISGWRSMMNSIGDIVYDAVKNIGNMISNLGSDLAHPIKTVERLSSKIGEPVHAHASGGAIDHTEMSLVNEKGQESAYNPHNNTFRLLGNNGPQVLKLYQGEHVLNAQDTRELLTTGLGRGVTLPGYANGTDSLKNLNREHGTQVVSKTQQDAADKLTGFRSTVSSAGKSANALKKLMGAGKNLDVGLSGVGKGVMHSNDAFDLADAGVDLLGKGRMSNKLGHAGLDLGNAAGAAAIGTAIGGPIGTLVGAGVGLGAPMLEKKLGINGHSVAKATHSLIKGISHPINALKHGWKSMKHIGHNIGSGIHKFGHNIARRTGQAWRGAKRIGRNALRGIRSFGSRALRGAKRIGSRAWRGIRHFGRGTMRFGRKLFRGGKRLLNRAGRGITRFGRHTWSGAKRLGRRLWSGTKQVARRMWSTTKRTAGRMWNSAKRTGKNIWDNTKRIVRNVGRTAHSLWNRTKAGAARTWSHVVSGARRMASRIGRVTVRLFHRAIAGGRRAWSAIKSGAASAVSHVKGLIHGMISMAASAAHHIENLFSHIHIPHFANGGPIRHSEMALVGEHGPETAYNSRTGVVRLLGLHGPQITTLLAGERVLTNTQTSQLLHGGLGQRLPSFAKGTDEVLDNSSYHPSKAMTITGLFSGTSALNKMRDFSKKAKAIWDDITGYTTKATKDTHSANNDEWSDMAKDLGKINDDLSKDTSNSFSDMSKKVGKLADDMNSGLVDAAEDMAEGFGDKFKKLITYAKHDMMSVIDKLNKGVSGIDVALRAFGGNSHVIHQIHYAKGTMNGRIAYDQLGILNDATSGPRQEAILRGNQMLFPQGNDVSVPLQKGDAVLNGDQTKELINNTTVNHYAKGSGLHVNFKHLHSLIKTIGLALKGPAVFFKKTFSHLVGEPSGHQLTKGLEESGIEAVKPLGVKWTRAMFKYIQSLLTPDGSGSASASAFLNYAERHRPSNYIFGGAPGLNDTDCSGFVEACLRHFGISAPRTSGAQIAHFQHITRSEARPGDLLGTGDHIGIVADNGAHHYFSNHGPNGTHPAAGMSPYVPSAFPGGAASFARVPQLSKFNKPKHKKHIPLLEHLVASELGASAIHWLKALAPMLSNSDGGAAGLATGNGVISTVWNEFAKLGLSPTQIEGALGGAKQESGFSPIAHDPDGGLGLFQATPPYGNLREYAAEHHEDWKNPAVQAKQYFEHWLKPGGYLGTHGSVNHEAYEAASIEAHSHVDSGLAPDSDFSVRLAGAHEIQHWYESHQHANGGWASRPSIFGEAGPEVAINPARDTADRLIVQAIGARLRHTPNSPIAGLVKSLGIRRKARSLADDIKDLLTEPANPKPKRNNPIKINVTNNITIQGNPGTNQAQQITRNVEKAIQRGVQRAALRTRNRIDW